jgi:Raf kinase inhibitor-like YbhB/YbcL family protein
MAGNSLTLKSPAFGNRQDIPSLYTCEGKNISPPLQWADVPEGTKSFVLIVDDPDAPDPKAPKRVFTHWLVYNIPPTVNALAEGISVLPAGSQVGMNDRQRTSWTGPCPPIGKHRYFHKLYALDSTLDFPQPPSKSEVETAMKSHVLGQAELIGLYEKSL